jgi:multidrug efflux pump subunit AcrB
MDVVRTVNDNNLILPAGDVRIGPTDYNLYTNSQLPDLGQIEALPLKTVGNASVLVRDVGQARDAEQIQTNVVRVDGQRSVYLPILKQGGDTSTLAVVDGIQAAIRGLTDVPHQLVASVVFDQSLFVRRAIENLLHEGGIGLVLTGLMILLFLGSMRATVAVFLSIPLSALAAFLAISAGGGTVNTMVLGGLALAFSRLIDNSVVVLENIFRHMEEGETAEVAAERGGAEVALPVLAATLTTSVVFLPVIFLYGVSRFLFTALAIAVVLSLAASFFVAMTIVPLFCARFLRKAHLEEDHVATRSRFGRFIQRFNHWFERMLDRYDSALVRTLARPGAMVAGILGVCLVSFAMAPKLGIAFFPRTDPGQFVINLKAPSGTRLELTEGYIQRVENEIRKVVPKEELGMIVANIGATPDFSAIYTPNSAQHTAFVQVSLKDDHRVGSYEYMNRVRARLATGLPELSTYFQSGGLVDAVLNLGLPAPIDVQVSGNDLDQTYATAVNVASRIRKVPGVSDILVPQDVDYPALKLDIDRTKASLVGLSQKEVVNNVITALTSNQMIAPSFWVDPKTGNDYMLTVQYRENQIHSLSDLKQIPIRSAASVNPTHLDSVVRIRPIESPTEVDHYQLRRVVDVYVTPRGEDLGRLASAIDRIVGETKLPEGVRVSLRGSVQGMRASFKSFAFGLILSVALVYLILVAQFSSFLDPFIILLAIPPGLTGVLLTLLAAGSTLNVMSLMGVVMMVGIVVSNSILIVDFTRHLRAGGAPLKQAVAEACRIRLRPVLMTSLATIIGLIPMAMKLGTGAEAYAPLAQAIIGGLLVSVVVTVFLVPGAYLLLHRRDRLAVVEGRG